MNTLILRSQIESAMSSMEVASPTQLSIRQLVTLVAGLERESGREFIHFEIGSPGLPSAALGVEAQKEALDRGVSACYPPLDGVPELKEATSKYVAAVVGTSISPTHCVPTVGSMQGVLASMLACAHFYPGRDTILFLDPGFPVQKTQADVLGIRRESFDIYQYRAERLGPKLEEYLAEGRVAAIVYSNPNNPSWMCLTESELETIGRLSDKYDVIVLEDLAYATMDFRRSEGGVVPGQVSVSHYCSNYIVLLSSSKIFSYAGERVGVACISDSLFERYSERLNERYGLGRFGNVFIHRLLYTFSSGVSHSAQLAVAAMFRQAAEGTFRYREALVEYAERTSRLKEIFEHHGFHVVYDKDIDVKVGDGFFFTIGYGDMEGGELLIRLLMCGISGIVLSSTGSVYHGIRACSSAIKPHHYSLLDERLAMFVRGVEEEWSKVK